MTKAKMTCLTKPFLAVDGEASETREDGSQDYNLMVIGQDHIVADDKALCSSEIFDFILDQPNDVTLVGYYIGYDVTMWLRDLPKEKLDDIFSPRDGIKTYTYWNGYSIRYYPNSMFEIARLERGANDKERIAGKSGRPSKRPITIPGSYRIIYDVSGYFRGPFITTLETMGIGTNAERSRIEVGKNLRGKPQRRSDIIRYCKLECALLAQLMTKFQGMCLDNVDMLAPEKGFQWRWNGAGALANGMLRKYAAPRKDAITAKQDMDLTLAQRRRKYLITSHSIHQYPQTKEFARAVLTSYFGGRIECRRFGNIPGPVYETDINSAYPAAMTLLPCPLHTQWWKFEGKPKEPTYIARGKLRMRGANNWGLLPVRVKETQAITFPFRADGWWHSPELHIFENGCDHEGQFKFQGGYEAVRHCNCRPWRWIQKLYDLRMELDGSLPIKLGLNALYGKLAQRRGRDTASYRDMVAAGFITSMVRAWVRDMLLQSDDAIMCATDAVYSTKQPVNSDFDGLGGRKTKELKSGIFVAQPGVFWTNDHDIVKNRGMPHKQLRDAIPKIENAWNLYSRSYGLAFPIPKITIPIELFLGHKAASELNRPQDAGKWIKHNVILSLDWGATGKRSLHGIWASHGDDNSITTFAPTDRIYKSAPYDADAVNDIDAADIILEAQPDGTI